MTVKTPGKTFVKNPIQGTKFTIAISSAKGGVGKSTFATNLALALKKIGTTIIIFGPNPNGDTLNFSKRYLISDKTLVDINE